MTRERGCNRIEGTDQSDAGHFFCPSYIEARRRARAWLKEQPDSQLLNHDWDAQVAALTDRYPDPDDMPDKIMDDAMDRLERAGELEMQYRDRFDEILLEVWDEEAAREGDPL